MRRRGGPARACILYYYFTQEGRAAMRLQDYEALYDLPAGEYDGRGIDGIRTTTIRAGRSLEVMCHPIFRRWPEGTKRAAKEKATKESMARLNQRNLTRKMMRLIEHNFTEAAFVLTGTYDYPAEDIGLRNVDDVLGFYQERGLPEAVEDIRRDIRNFIAKIKRRMKSAGVEPKKIKWLQRIEEGTKELPFGLPPRYHFHMVIEAEGLTQDEIKTCWAHGFTSCDRLDLKHDGAKRLAVYFTKQKRGGRWWSHSRNLKEPPRRVSDRKMSRRRAAKIAEDVRRNAREIFEKLYPGYRLMEEPEVRYSDFMAGAFIYARMRRLD